MGQCCLTSKSIQGASLPLQRVDDVHDCESFSLCMLGVGDCISDGILKEHLQDSSGLLVDEAGDALHSTTMCEMMDGRLSDTLDGITQHFPVPFGASFSQTLSYFAVS